MKINQQSPEYVKLNRGQTGSCNICQKPCVFELDHVPPQGGVDIQPMRQYTILECLAGTSTNPTGLITQNGVKYRTLCNCCNGQLLGGGGGYDETLNEFVLNVVSQLEKTKPLASQMSVVTKPARLLRSLFGHLLAAKADIEHTKPDVAMRKYVLNPSAPLPPELNVFFFVYPYRNVVVIRDIYMLPQRGNFDGMAAMFRMLKCVPNAYEDAHRKGYLAIFSILKYFPIAYVVTDVKEYEGLSSLSVHCPQELEEERSVTILLDERRAADWPEVVDDDNLVLGGVRSGHSSITAIPKGCNLRGPTNGCCLAVRGQVES